MFDYAGRNVVVTGADGFIGSHLAEALLTAGANVTALAQYNSFDSYGWLDDLAPEARAQMRLERGDVRDPQFMHELLRGQHVCMHLAALIAIPYSYSAPQSYVETNVTGTLNVLTAARQHGLERVVHTSTSEVYGTAQARPISEKHPLQGQSPYSASKIGADMQAEAFARSFDMPVVIHRPFNTFGPRQSERAVIPTIIRQVLDPSCETIELGDLSPERDFTFVEDTASAFLALGTAEDLFYGEVYNGGTGHAVTIGQTLDMILELTGCEKSVRQDNQRVRPARSEVQALIADNTKLETATGWSPRTDLRSGLDKTINWWRERLSQGAVRPESSYMV